jgi:uncharacterized protein (TIGR02246 family)
MMSTRVLIAAAAATTIVVVGAAQQKKETKKDAASGAQTTASRDADEAAIRVSVDAFAKAYNAHDATAIAALFAEQAKIVAEDGDVIEGRTAIEQVFAGIFADEPKTQIEVNVASIRFIGSDLAVEAGSTKTINAPGETPEYDRYTVLHVKRDGKWLMGLARDMEGDKPSSHEQLMQLEWLIGDWIDESPDSLVRTSFRWSDNDNFILGEFTVHLAGRPAMSGTQRIGWDPVAKKVRSWVFDSEGGFAEALWIRQGDQWIVKSQGVNHEGEVGSGTNVYTRVGKDRFAIASRDRIIGDEMVPDIENIIVVRVPPKPAVK